MNVTRNPRCDGLHLLCAQEVADYLNMNEIEVIQYFFSAEIAPTDFPRPLAPMLTSGSLRWRNTDVEQYRINQHMPDYTFKGNDVAKACPHLDEDQCHTVLYYVFDNYDSQRGIDDGVFTDAGNLLFPRMELNNLT